jgi:hypothetical protein
MAYKPQVNLKNINKSISSLNSSVSSAKTSAKSIGQSILETNRKKRGSISSSISSFRKRREAVQRKEREDIVEASTIGGAIQKSRTAALSSTKGFLGRILDFIGTLLVGWAISNLPSIIKMAQDLMERMKTYFSVLSDFKEGLQEFLVTFGDTVVGISGSLINFDFVSTKRILDNNMKKMQDSLVKMDNSLSQAFEMLREDVYKMLGIEKPTPGGEDGGGFLDVLPGDDAKAGSGGTKYPELAALVSSGEGGLNSVNRGNAGDTPGGAKSIFGKNLTEMTVGEIMEAQNQGRVFAVGKYQFIPGTLRGAVKYTNIPLNTLFDSVTQNRLFDYLIDVKRPEIGNYLNGRSNDRRTAIQQLAREFAAIGLEYPEAGRGRGQSRYSGTGGNRASISPDSAGRTLDGIRKNRSRPKAPPPNTVQTRGGADDPVKITYPDGTTDVIKPGTKIGALPQEAPKFASTKKDYSTELAITLGTGKRRKTDVIIYNNEIAIEKPTFIPVSSGIPTEEINVAYSSVNSSRIQRDLSLTKLG